MNELNTDICFKAFSVLQNNLQTVENGNDILFVFGIIL